MRVLTVSFMNSQVVLPADLSSWLLQRHPIKYYFSSKG